METKGVLGRRLLLHEVEGEQRQSEATDVTKKVHGIGDNRQGVCENATYDLNHHQTKGNAYCATKLRSLLI